MRTSFFTMWALLIIVLFLSSKSNAQVTNGLVAHYSFNGNSLDQVGNKHGTVQGAVLDTGRGGVPNAAYYFDGVNDFIDFGNIDPVGSSSDVTLCVWFRPFLPVVPADTANIVSTIDNEYLFSTGGQTSSTGYALLWAKGAVQGARRTPSQWVATKHAPYVDNSWHHSCIVYNNTLNRMELYTDNVLKIDTIGSLGGPSSSFLNIQAGKPNNSNNFFFEGLIDDIKIYNRALSVQEIDTLCTELISCDSYNADTIVACDLYVSPSGKYNWTLTGTYIDTIQNVAGCDSILTIYLTVDTINESLIVTDTSLNALMSMSKYQWLNCDSSYKILSGDTLQQYIATGKGNYAVEITSFAGCKDTSLCYPLTCRSYANISDTVCEGLSYASPSGKYNWNSTGTYIDTIQNVAGCDSILTIYLTVDTINESFIVTDTSLNALMSMSKYQWLNCDSSYKILSGDTLQQYIATGKGNYAVEITSFAGCKDTSLCYPLTCRSYSNISESLCEGSSYVSPSGKVWFKSGAYRDTVLTSSGCDSIISINLLIQKIDTTITVSGNVLVSNTNGMNYQWLDCDSGMVPISGATNQVYTVSKSGNYTVVISGNGCADTSACQQVLLSGLTEVDQKEIMLIYPNPSNGELFVNYSFVSPVAMPAIRIVDIQGKVVHEERLNESIHQSSLRLDIDLAAGNYILQFTSSGSVIESEKFIVQ